ncbi:unnamed protein product [Calicophoron daubneyi]|uniref:Uncharacterized protein n=1 Tax=Calicophoron daubneyi TaxID=300641 RepID=A0AAV2U131_CALDB
MVGSMQNLGTSLSENASLHVKHSHITDRLRIPLIIGIGLVSFGVLILLLLLLIFCFRRTKRYKHLPTDFGDWDEEDCEITTFDAEKTRFAAFANTESQISASSRGAKMLEAVASLEGELNSAFSIGDEDEKLSAVEGSIPRLYSGSNPITVTTSAMPVRHQLSECTTTAKSTDTPDSDGITRMEPEPKSSSVSQSRASIRRVSSTPNLLFQKTPDTSAANVFETSDEGTLCSTPLDDRELFADVRSDDEDMIDTESTITNEKLNTTSGSIGDVASMRSFLPITLPKWALEAGTPERGFMVFALTINQSPNKSGNGSFIMDVRILEARCILSHQMDPCAGKFYVKAKIQPAGTLNTLSVLSLDQMQPKLKLNPFSHSRSSVISSGRTPVRRAVRSPVFWHAITLELPADFEEVSKFINSRGPIFGDPIPSATDSNLLELRLDLKEKNAMKTDNLYGTTPAFSFPQWRNSQILGSVRIPLEHRMWQYFLEPEDKPTAPLRRSTLVPHTEEGTDTSENEKKQLCAKDVQKDRVLRFVRRLEPPPEDAGSRGELTIGLQYNPDTTKLTLNPLKCSGIHLPKGTKIIFLRASLVSNRKIICTQNSNPSARLTMNAAEFLLGERIQFVVEENLTQVCLVLSVFSRSGGKFNTNTNLIGRCVTGPSGLAYGEGLSHWNAVCTRRRMIKRTHVLF